MYRLAPLAGHRPAALGLLATATALPAFAAQTEPLDPSLHAPVRVTAAGLPIEVEAPGFAFPAWHDVTGDGRADLVVGQFNGGKMKVFPRGEDGTFLDGHWLEAEGGVAEVPGVW
ncbi:MAG: hypothetical protein AAGA20_12150 [Planctomycetota bacterium]